MRDTLKGYGYEVKQTDDGFTLSYNGIVLDKAESENSAWDMALQYYAFQLEAAMNAMTEQDWNDNLMAVSNHVLGFDK